MDLKQMRAAALKAAQDIVNGAKDRDMTDAEQAEAEWRDLDHWVKWLKSTFGLPPNIVPPYWHRHDELVWELSALHCHWLSCYHESASPSAPIAWMRDFSDAFLVQRMMRSSRHVRGLQYSMI